MLLAALKKDRKKAKQEVPVCLAGTTKPKKRTALKAFFFLAKTVGVAVAANQLAMDQIGGPKWKRPANLAATNQY